MQHIGLHGEGNISAELQPDTGKGAKFNFNQVPFQEKRCKLSIPGDTSELTCMNS